MGGRLKRGKVSFRLIWKGFGMGVWNLARYSLMFRFYLTSFLSMEWEKTFLEICRDVDSFREDHYFLDMPAFTREA